MQPPSETPQTDEPPRLVIHRLRARRRLASVWAVVAAVALAMIIVPDAVPPLWLAWLLIPAAAVALHGSSRRRVRHLLYRLRRPSPRAATLVAVSLGIAAIVTVLIRAHLGQRWMGLNWHDEFSYRLGALHLSIGRLWLPSPEHPAFFDTFHVLVEPVYASIYWPGTALLNAPGIWLGLPTWGVPILLYGATVALVYKVFAMLSDGQAALLAALVAAVSLDFMGFATRVMSQGPTAFLAIAAIFLWLRWRNAAGHGTGWLVVIGVLFGLLAITRPVDGLAFAVPLTVAIVWRSAARAGLRRAIFATTALALPTLPFLALQVTLNVGTTGRWHQPPYVRYLEQAQPGTQFLADEGAADAIGTRNPKKQELYEAWLRPMLIGRLPVRDRIERALDGAAPGLGWAWLILIGTAACVVHAALGPRRRRMPILLLPAAAGLFMLLYLPNPIFLEHYAIPLVILIAPLAATGLRFIETALPPRLRPSSAILLSGGAAAVMLASLADVSRQVPAPRLLAMKTAIEARTAADERLLIFVPYRQGEPHAEMVYNVAAPRIDDNDIVWAHDLGERNGDLIDAFRGRQPDRQPMRLDLDTGRLEPLE